MVVSKGYNLPSTTRKYAGSGGAAPTLKSATIQYRVLSIDGTKRPWADVDDELRRGRRLSIQTYENPGTTGLVVSRYKVEIEYTEQGVRRVARATVVPTNPVVRYKDTRCLTGRPSSGYVRISYMRSEETGGLRTMDLLPENLNPKRCAYNDWATEGVAYQAQICKGSLCTFPKLVGGSLSTSAFRGTREFDAGISDLAGEPRSTNRTYSIVKNEGSYTGQATFETWMWPYINGQYDDMEDYVLFQACSGFQCEGPQVIKGKSVGSRVR